MIHQTILVMQRTVTEEHPFNCTYAVQEDKASH